MISSQIVKPLPPVIIKNVKELLARNYTLVYELEIQKEFVMSIAFSRNSSIIYNLTKRAEVKGNEFIKRLAFGYNKATFAAWPAVSRWANMAKTLINANPNMKYNKYFKRKECFLGMELISSGLYFYGILPPNHDNLSKVRILFESGIYRFWLEEYFGLAKAARVQDRGKMKSPTKLGVDEFSDGNRVPALNIYGKMLKAFVLYTICNIVCSCV